MDKEKKTPEDWELAIAFDMFDCYKKAIVLVEERGLIGWRTGQLIDALADMYFQNADCEESIQMCIKVVRGDLAVYEKYTIG